MADIIHLCGYNSSLKYTSSSFNNFYPILIPKLNSFKRVSNDSVISSSSRAVVVVSASNVFASEETRKRAPLVKVHAAVAETTDQPKWWEKNPGPNMVDIHSTEEFLSALSGAGDKLVVAEFYGTWCASCRALFPRLCRMAEEHPEILFLKVNFDENKPMCKSMNVKVLPYFHFYRGAAGKVEGFSCSLAKFQKVKDAIEMYNPGSDTNKAAKETPELQAEAASNISDKSTEPDNT